MTDSIIEYPAEDLEAMGAGKNYVQWIHSFFEPYILGSVAEVGAGIGVYSKVLLESQNLTDLTVFEPSANLVGQLSMAVRHGRRPAKCLNSFFEVEPGKQYDTVIYINVMEHIEGDEAEMEKVHRSLKSKGKLLVFVPALPFLYSENDRKVGHYRRYTKKELTGKVEGAGFRIVEQRYFDSLGVLSWLICCKWMKMIPEAGSVFVYDKLFVPVLRVLERIVPPRVGKNLLLVAEKE